jgi:hypothetical protein
MRVLVCGGRHFDDRPFLNRSLNRLHRVRPITLLIHGASKGADTLAGEWALAKGITVDPYPADWDRHGNLAGRIRNGQMLRASKPSLVVAFPGGTGTHDMKWKAENWWPPVPVWEPKR